MYLSMAVIGYLSMMARPVGLITDRVPPPSFGNADIFMPIGRIAMTVNLLIALPVNLNPCRSQILMLMKKHEEYNQARHVIITGILLFGSAGLAILYPDINSVFGIIGGTSSTMIGITFPSKQNFIM